MNSIMNYDSIDVVFFSSFHVVRQESIVIMFCENYKRKLHSTVNATNNDQLLTNSISFGTLYFSYSIKVIVVCMVEANTPD